MTDPVVNDRTAGYVDLQVNGYHGVDFNGDDLSAEALHEVCQQLESDGVEGILATVITDQVDRMAARLARLAKLREADPIVQAMIWGVHIEGPFLSDQPGFVGSHPPSDVCPASVEKMQGLLDAADGLTRIVTLAPEFDAGLTVTRTLADQGICVSAGHCNPSLDQLDAGIDAGITMFTHLGNGCPMELHRHDNIIQRVLSRANRLWISFVADGVHIPWPALGNYVKAVGLDRSIVVTDAISAAGLGAGKFQLGDQEVIVDEQGATWSADHSHLAGSSATMPLMKAHLQKELGLSDNGVAQLICHNPRSVIASSK